MKKIIISLLASLIVFPVISQESSMIRRDTIIIYNPETHQEQIRVVEYNPANRNVADCYFISWERGIISKLDNGGLIAKTNLHLTQKNLEISYYSESSCNAIVELVHADTELFLENTKIADYSFSALPLQISFESLLNQTGSTEEEFIFWIKNQVVKLKSGEVTTLPDFQLVFSPKE